MFFRILLGAFIVCSSGCINIPLRSTSVGQARTVSDLYQQQVLNNVAMFASDSNSLPHFSYATQGAAAITDQGTLALTPTWSKSVTAFGLASIVPTFTGQRTTASNFVLTPVNDPRKLELMRCAYQKVVAGCCGGEAQMRCPDCQTRFKVFYTGNPDGLIPENTNGVVTSECLGETCWFGFGCKKCVPRDCDPSLVGQYGDMYVWVLPGGRDELSRLTIAILDYAQNAPPQQVQKIVEYYLDERGLPTSFANAVSKVTAQIGVTENNLSLLSQPREDEVQMRDDIESELEVLQAKIDVANAKNHTTELEELQPLKTQLEAKKRYLDQQLKTPALKEQYRQGIAPPSGPGALLFNQTLSTLTPTSSGK